TNVRMIGVSLRQQHRRVNINRMSPELRQLLALDADMLHPLGILRRRWCWNDMGELQARDPRIPNMNRHGIAVEISLSDLKRCLLSIVDRNPDRMSIGTVQLGVDIQNSLRVVIAFRQICEFPRIAAYLRVNHRGPTRLPVADVDAENLGAVESHLISRLGTGLLRQHQNQSSGERSRVHGGSVGDFKLRRYRAQGK